MSQFTELKEKFFSETGICAVNSQGEPDIDYVNWLETMVENGSSHNSAMVPCLKWHNDGGKCVVLFAGEKCGDTPCLLTRHQ